MDRPEAAPWKLTYQGLDNSALLSLLPALDSVIAKTEAELDLMTRSHQAESQSSEFVAMHLQNAMRLREQGVDVSEYVATAEGLADLTAAGVPARVEAIKAVFAYLVDLTTRKRWILQEEARRRGLLPDPADYPYPAASAD